MKFYSRFRKRLATLSAGAIIASTLITPVFASDYEDHWAKDAIERWKVKEVLNEYEDGTFRPKQAITRAELAKIIVEIFGLNNTQKAKTYTDVDPKEWYASYIAAVSSAGIMNDEGATFKPNQAATREEAAYAVAMAYNLDSRKHDEENQRTL